MRLWQHEQQPQRLQQRTARADEPDAQALACYGLWCARTEQMFLRFVNGRPVSHVTTAFVEWTCGELAQQGAKVLVLIWDNASWHVSGEVREWIAAHNRQAKLEGAGIRIIVVGLPTKSPWLNNIEAKWQHGKKATVAAEHELTGAEVEERVCGYFRTAVQPRLVQVKKEQASGRAARVQPATVGKSGRPRQAAKTQ